MDRSVHHLRGDRASRSARARTLPRLAMTIEVRGRCAGTAQAVRAEKDLRAAAAALVGAEHA